jgi:molecular chaperone GrpE (heat shock protein)
MNDLLDQGATNQNLPLTDLGEKPPEALNTPGPTCSPEAVTASPDASAQEAGVPNAEEMENPSGPVSVSDEVSASLAMTATLERLAADVGGVQDTLAAVEARLAYLETNLDTTAKQISFLPPQMRLLGNKIEGVAASLSEPRYRAVLLSLLAIYDLVNQMLRSLPSVPESDAMADDRRNYQVLRTQLRQTLESNGLSEIETGGPFDPELHRAVQRIPCDDPAQAGRVVEVVRPGFRTEQAVLRYAEVSVSQYVPPQAESGAVGETDQALNKQP